MRRGEKNERRSTVEAGNMIDTIPIGGWIPFHPGEKLYPKPLPEDMINLFPFLIDPGFGVDGGGTDW